MDERGVSSHGLAMPALGVLLFVVVNVVLFATPLYRGLLAPASTTGSFERGLGRVDRASGDALRDVLVLGDSRIFSGFDASAAERAARGFHFVNAGIPGTTPRCWSVFDRALDPGATRYRAVVIPVDSYGDDDGAIGSVDGDGRSADLHYIVLQATWREIWTIAASFPSLEGRLTAFFDLLLRGPLLRDDVATFVENPRARLNALRSGTTGEPDVRDGTLAGLQANFSRETLVVPPAYPQTGLDELRRQVLHVAAASPAYGTYRRRWLGPIVRRYRARNVAVIFVRIPTRPLHRARPSSPSGSLLEFARRDGATLLPQDRYVDVERPELFVDADHLNRAGAERFSTMLAFDVARALHDPASLKTTAVAGRDAARASMGESQPVGQHRWPLLAALASALSIGVPIRFQSYEFALFFAAVAIAFYSVPDARARRNLLLAASWYFYVRWNAWYLVVLLGLTATDYAFARSIEPAVAARRRTLLTCGVVANLAFLGTAKYADFFTANVAGVLGFDGDPWALHVLGPVGISFHTFQSISYLVDVFRGKVRAVRDPLDYALYIAFFPQLLAGPIVRAARFFGELSGWRSPQRDDVLHGLGEIVLGLLKKGVIADRFAAFSDAYFGGVPAHPGAPAAWGGALAFGLQIYFDFSGYSDIAIGSARVLGFAFPPNFRRPYLAWSLSEFWRRWHISLSTWLRDYVYIPLGGNRQSPPATVRNLMLTMLLGGLWHGASWTFVAWGGYHAALLSLERHVAPRLARVPATVLTFVLVLLGWVLFRAQSFSDASAVLREMLRAAPAPHSSDRCNSYPSRSRSRSNSPPRCASRHVAPYRRHCGRSRPQRPFWRSNSPRIPEPQLNSFTSNFDASVERSAKAVATSTLALTRAPLRRVCAGWPT